MLAMEGAGARDMAETTSRREQLRALKLSSEGYGQLCRLVDLGTLQPSAKQAVDGLYREIADARFALAEARIREARLLASTSSRAAICAAYYAMYHAGRAALLIVTKGEVDDKGKVEVQLGKQFGQEFAEQLAARRGERNDAEYDPLADLSGREDDLAARLDQAEQFVLACRKKVAP